MPGARKDSAIVLQRKHRLVADAIRGRTSADATSLSRSFGLPVEDVRRILRSSGVRDDG